jgi:acetylornithine deacetylase
MDTIIMGPGNIDQAHQPDEYVSMDMLEPAIAVMQKLIVKYCEPS